MRAFQPQSLASTALHALHGLAPAAPAFAARRLSWGLQATQNATVALTTRLAHLPSKMLVWAVVNGRRYTARLEDSRCTDHHAPGATRAQMYTHIGTLQFDFRIALESFAACAPLGKVMLSTQAGDFGDVGGADALPEQMLLGWATVLATEQGVTLWEKPDSPDVWGQDVVDVPFGRQGHLGAAFQPARVEDGKRIGLVVTRLLRVRGEKGQLELHGVLPGMVLQARAAAAHRKRRHATARDGFFCAGDGWARDRL